MHPYQFKNQKLIRELSGEFLGTFLLLLVGISANIQSTCSQSPEISRQIAWGLGFMFSVFIASKTGHLNPSISVAQWVLGNLKTFKLPLFIFAQTIGAFTGAALAYGGHYDDIQRLKNQSDNVLNLFVTFSSPGTPQIISFLYEIIGTSVLSGAVCIITDKTHQIPKFLVPVLSGLLISMLTMSFGACAINPARDFAPRMFCYLLGYQEVFSVDNGYFWIPITGPVFGAVIGAWIYKVFIGIHR